MAVRKIIEIDDDLCDGCGDCITACHEGAIQLIDGKARLVSESYCDGLGDCLGECPQGAITIVERECADYDQAAVDEHLSKKDSPFKMADAPSGCPGSATQELTPPPAAAQVPSGCPGAAMRQMGGPAAATATAPAPGAPGLMPSQLKHWPIQLMLVPPHAPFLQDAHIVVCADCVPFTVPDFHQRYLTNNAVLVGCPKLDDLPHYLEKLKAIFATAQPKAITVLRMEVPCCSGIAQVAIQARKATSPDTPLEVHTIRINGEIYAEAVPGN